MTGYHGGALSTARDIANSYGIGLKDIGGQTVQALRNLPGAGLVRGVKNFITAAPVSTGQQVMPPAKVVTEDPVDAADDNTPTTAETQPTSTTPAFNPTGVGHDSIVRSTPFVNHQLDLIKNQAAYMMSNGTDPQAVENYIKYASSGVANAQSLLEQHAINKAAAAAGITKTDPNTGVTYTSSYDKAGAPVAPQTEFQKQGITPVDGVDAANHALKIYHTKYGDVSTYQGQNTPPPGTGMGTIDGVPSDQANRQLAQELLRGGIINPGSRAEVVNHQIMSAADPDAVAAANAKVIADPNYNRPSITAPTNTPADTRVTSSGLPAYVAANPASYGVSPQVPEEGIAATPLNDINSDVTKAAAALPKQNFQARVDAERALEHAQGRGPTSDLVATVRNAQEEAAAAKSLAAANNDADHPEKYIPYNPDDPVNPQRQLAYEALNKGGADLMAKALASSSAPMPTDKLAQEQTKDAETKAGLESGIDYKGDKDTMAAQRLAMQAEQAGFKDQHALAQQQLQEKKFQMAPEYRKAQALDRDNQTILGEYWRTRNNAAADPQTLADMQAQMRLNYKNIDHLYNKEPLEEPPAQNEAASKPTPLPDVKQRVVGQIYTNPAGLKAVWTGNTLVPVKS